MKLEKKLTEWLYYRSIYEFTAGKSKMHDPKYVSMLPDEDKFEEHILSCDLEEFISVMITICNENYPRNHMSLEGMLSWDKVKETTIEGKVFREQNDIEKALFVVDGDDLWDPLQYLKLYFTEAQPAIYQWVENELADKIFTVETNEETKIFKLEKEWIKQIKVEPKYFELEINLDLLDEFWI